MTADEPEDEIEVDGEYEPQPAGLSDGDTFIFDRAEFEQEFDCYAAMSRDGQLYVLCKQSRKWVSVESRGIEPPKAAGRLTRVQ